MANNPNQAADKTIAALKSQSIYLDKKGRTVYYQQKTQTGYVIPEDQLKNFSLLRNRYLIAISLALLSYYFFSLTWYYSLFLGIAIAGGLEYHYRKNLLGKFIKIEKFKPEAEFDKKKDPYIGVSSTKINLTVVFYLVLAVLMLASILIFPGNTTNTVFMVIFSLCAFYMAYRTYRNFH